MISPIKQNAVIVVTNLKCRATSALSCSDCKLYGRSAL